MKTKDKLLNAAYVILCMGCIAWACVVLGGCRAAREAKKDEQAIARILGKKELSDKMFAALEISHPCKPITTTIIKKGKDSFIYIPKLVLDAVAYQKLKDSLLSNLEKVNDECGVSVAIAASDAYNKGFDAATKLYANRPIPFHTPDTTITSEQDGRKIDQLEKERDVLQGMYNQSEKGATIASHEAKNRLWWIVALCVALCGSLFWNVKGVFRKIPKAFSNILGSKS